MSEQPPDRDGADADSEQVRTGVPRVDAVIDEVADLDGRPVDEHVAVFESAHDELRHTLDDPGAVAPDDHPA